MKFLITSIAVLAVVSAVLIFVHLHLRKGEKGPVAHVKNGFELIVRAPYEKVFPLFGAHGERAWGGDDWDPHFLHPQPAQDVEGEVFTVVHGHTHATWVNTAFDPASGHVQYVYVVPDAQAVRIDIHLLKRDSANTGVNVVYERTSLNAGLNEHITKLGKKDAQSAAEWQSAIEASLGVSKN